MLLKKDNESKTSLNIQNVIWHADWLFEHFSHHIMCQHQDGMIHDPSHMKNGATYGKTVGDIALHDTL